MKRPAPPGERGFALLIVFLMAAVIAFTLYRQLPRVAFESQRDKEELLMERGEQFKRAIQLFVVANKRYPAKIEDLENTNNKRYLRRRYVDPLTGKDEWRLIHVNAAGLLTDSLVQKPPAAGVNAGNNPLGGSPLGGNPPAGNPLAGNQPVGNQPAGSDPSPGSTGTATGQEGQPQPVNAAVLRRPSDRSLVQDPGMAGAPPVDPNNDPSQWPAITLLPATSPGGQPNRGQPNPQFNPQLQGQFPPGQQFPGQPFPGQPFTPAQPPTGEGQPFPVQQFPGQPSTPQPQNGFPPAGFQPGVPGQLPGQAGFNPQLANQNIQGQNSPGQNQLRIGPNGQFVPVTNLPGQVVNTQTGGVQPAQTPQQFPPNFAPAGGSPAGGPGGAANPALDLINKLLTSPSPNGPNAAGNNNTVPGGIAGVASTYEGPSIKIYGKRQKYNEWEFVFDLKSTQPGARPPQTPQTPETQPNPQTQPTQQTQPTPQTQPTQQTPQTPQL